MKSRILAIDLDKDKLVWVFLDNKDRTECAVCGQIHRFYTWDADESTVPVPCQTMLIEVVRDRVNSDLIATPEKIAEHMPVVYMNISMNWKERVQEQESA